MPSCIHTHPHLHPQQWPWWRLLRCLCSRGLMPGNAAHGSRGRCHSCQWCEPEPQPHLWDIDMLTHWHRVTHICIGNLTIIGQDNGLPPGRRQAIICTNAGILLIGPCGTGFSEILIGIHTFSFIKIRLENVVCEMPSILSRPQCVNGIVVSAQYKQESSFI